MKKKYSIIFIGLGITLLVTGLLFNFTDLFDQKNNKNTPNPAPIPVPLKIDFIKSHDTIKKTKISFPILNNLEVDKKSYDEFMKKYYNNENSLFYSAIIIETNKKAEEYSNETFDILKKMFKNDSGFNVISNNVECKYLCNKYQVIKNNEVFQQIFNVYIKSSDNDLAVITFKSSNKDIENDIKSILNNISVTNDATYTIGKINNEKLDLVFTLENDENVIFSLNSNLYEEISDGENTLKETRVKNKSTNETIVLKVYLKTEDLSINDFADRYFNSDEPGSNKKDISNLNKSIYEYDLNGTKGYAYIIDNEKVLLIQSDSSINVNDFINNK